MKAKVEEIRRCYGENSFYEIQIKIDDSFPRIWLSMSQANYLTIDKRMKEEGKDIKNFLEDLANRINGEG